MYNEHIKQIRDAGFPKVAGRIELCWGTKELRWYLNDILMVDKSRGSREGFPPVVFDHLLKLYFINEEIVGDDPTENSIW